MTRPLRDDQGSELAAYRELARLRQRVTRLERRPAVDPTSFGDWPWMSYSGDITSMGLQTADYLGDLTGGDFDWNDAGAVLFRDVADQGVEVRVQGPWEDWAPWWCWWQLRVRRAGADSAARQANSYPKFVYFQLVSAMGGGSGYLHTYRDSVNLTGAPDVDMHFDGFTTGWATGITEMFPNVRVYDSIDDYYLLWKMYVVAPTWGRTDGSGAHLPT